MMEYIIYRSLYLFFVVLEFILVIYIIMSWFPFGSKIKSIMRELTSPLLDPLRYLLKHSILYSQVADLSPIIAFFIISYMQKFFYSLL